MLSVEVKLMEDTFNLGIGLVIVYGLMATDIITYDDRISSSHFGKTLPSKEKKQIIKKYK